MKALISDHVHQVLITELESAGIQCSYLPELNQKEVETLIHDYEILVINSKIKINQAFLDLAKKLMVIGRLGSGLEIIDLKAAEQRKIKVYNSPEGNRDAVAEHAISMILSLFNKLFQANRDVIHFNWDREANRGEELMGKTVGIIGFGHTGKALAKKLSGFDVEVLFYDKYLKEEQSEFAKQVSLADIQQQSDIISFHVPYTAETHYFLDEEFIESMQKDFYLINTSRGKVLSQRCLLKALNTTKVKGACLDVFENEKIQSYSVREKEEIAALSKTGKVLFSTHVAGWTNQSKYKLGKILSQKIITALS